MRVIVTRPEGDAHQWVAGLRERGHDALALPLLVIAPVADGLPLRRAWQQLGEYLAVMFVSGHAVSHFFAVKPVESSVFTARAAIKTRAWAVGPGTVRALRAQHVLATLIDAPPPTASQFDSQALWQHVSSSLRPGQRVLIVRGVDTAPEVDPGATPADGAGRNWLTQQLQLSGVRVDHCEAYRRAPAMFDDRQRQMATVAASDHSVWLFSSAQAIRGLGASMAGTDWSHARAVATHSRIAQAARELGFGTVRDTRPALADVLGAIESMA